MYLRRQCSAKYSEETLNCSYFVDINFCGYRNAVCKFCNALTWSSESSSICCYSGKTSLPPIPDPPDLLKSLLTSGDERGVVFRKYIRQLNNALAMASVKIGNLTQDFNSFMPTVFLQVIVFSLILFVIFFLMFLFIFCFRASLINFLDP